MIGDGERGYGGGATYVYSHAKPPQRADPASHPRYSGAFGPATACRPSATAPSAPAPPSPPPPHPPPASAARPPSARCCAASRPGRGRSRAACPARRVGAAGGRPWSGRLGSSPRGGGLGHCWDTGARRRGRTRGGVWPVRSLCRPSLRPLVAAACLRGFRCCEGRCAMERRWMACHLHVLVDVGDLACLRREAVGYWV